MHVIITDTRFRSTRNFELGIKGLFAIAMCVAVVAIAGAMAAYHALVKAGTLNNWPIVGQSSHKSPMKMQSLRTDTCAKI